MKNNRQIGLDGKVFISACMHRGPLFVIILVFYGLLTAAADILKLTGASGVAMSPFTTTLLLYDFVVSLMLIVVVFYAYFLECGANVPVLKEKPIMVFGLFRLGYYVLLAYYICYRALYCIVNRDAVPTSLSFFYFVYLALIVLLILANCYIFNTLARNIIRRSYGKSFRRLAACGIVLQALLPIAYIFARIFMKDIGDEYFTTAVCDLIRLCVCPILLTSIWFLFLHGVEQVKEIYGEVDSALRSKQYQITYTADGDSKKNKPHAHKASATVLPAPSASVFSLPAKKSDNASSEPKAIPSAIETAVASAAADVTETDASADKSSSDNSDEKEKVTTDTTKSETDDTGSESSEKSEEKTPNVPADVAAAIAAIDNSEESNESNDEIIADFAAEARKAVAKTSSAAKAKSQQSKPQSQNNSQQKKRQPSQNSPQRKQQRPQGNAQNRTAAPKVGGNAPVQEFDPFPADSVPRRPQQNGQHSKNNQRQGGHNPNNRPQQGARPAQRGSNPGNNRTPSGNNTQRNNPGRH